VECDLGTRVERKVEPWIHVSPRCAVRALSKTRVPETRFPAGQRSGTVLVLVGSTPPAAERR
jgi:hypothetical protein